MKKIGITGNIGSGKSTVARIFSILGIPVYNSDERAKWLMSHDPKLVAEIKTLFGDQAYNADGQLNRTLIAELVFTNKDLIAALNHCVHPAVFRDFDEWVEEQDAPYVLKEAALLIESGSYLNLDQLILVTAPQALRIERAIKRDHMSEDAVLARMKNQLPESEKAAFAAYQIQNDGIHLLIPQVIQIHEELLQK